MKERWPQKIKIVIVHWDHCYGCSSLTSNNNSLKVGFYSLGKGILSCLGLEDWIEMWLGLSFHRKIGKKYKYLRKLGCFLVKGVEMNRRKQTTE